MASSSSITIGGVVKVVLLNQVADASSLNTHAAGRNLVSPMMIACQSSCLYIKRMLASLKLIRRNLPALVMMICTYMATLTQEKSTCSTCNLYVAIVRCIQMLNVRVMKKSQNSFKINSLSS